MMTTMAMNSMLTMMATTDVSLKKRCLIVAFVNVRGFEDAAGVFVRTGL